MTTFNQAVHAPALQLLEEEAADVASALHTISREGGSALARLCSKADATARSVAAATAATAAVPAPPATAAAAGAGAGAGAGASR
jgi:hypothetical protein